MVLELHVWGPAFGLPSIDQDCLAAVAYFTEVVPVDQWVLAEDTDEGTDLRQLPAVRDGAATVCGFENIVGYLKTISHGQWDLDAPLTVRQKADCTAFSSLLVTQALPLLDLSLYVSSQNYNTTVRSAYASLLSFPSSWVIPTKRRAAAKQRSAHLGLSSLDLNSTSQVEGNSQTSAAASAQIPRSLRKAKVSVSAAVHSPETAARIRLQSLTENVLDPLSALLTEDEDGSPPGYSGGYLLSPSQASSLDCITVAYLALFLLPAVPHPFLATTLRDKYPDLTSYVRKGIERCYGGAVRPEDARPGIKTANVPNENAEIDHSADDNLKIKSGRVILPWRDATPMTVLSSTTLVLKEVFDAVPIIGPLLKPDPILYTDGTRNTSRDSVLGTTRMGLLPTALAVVAGVGALGGALLYSGAIDVGRADASEYRGKSGRNTRLADMGEVGEALALGSFGGAGSWKQDSREGLPPNDSVAVADVTV
ncbi:hypothetical protein MMC13_000604 [Lambiella insularis]|nr:hypothetical protein [Lambiella insularis]